MRCRGEEVKGERLCKGAEHVAETFDCLPVSASFKPSTPLLYTATLCIYYLQPPTQPLKYPTLLNRRALA